VSLSVDNCPLHPYTVTDGQRQTMFRQVVFMFKLLYLNTKSYGVKKVNFVIVTLLIVLAGCKKSAPVDPYALTNVDITATSTGTFNIKIIQKVGQTGQDFTEFNTLPISSCDKKLLTSKNDEVDVIITNATAPVHLVVTYKGTIIDDEQGLPTTNGGSNIGYTGHF
jgi:hypothetical protein